MVRFKTVSHKAGGGTAPTQPVLTQDVEAEVARATEAAQHVARLRAMLDGDGSEDGDDGEAVVVSSRPNAPKAKRSRSQKKGKKEKEKEDKEKEKEVYVRATVHPPTAPTVCAFKQVQPTLKFPRHSCKVQPRLNYRWKQVQPRLNNGKP